MTKLSALSKFVLILLVFTLNTIPVYASDSKNIINKQQSLAEKVVYQEIAAENSNSWSDLSNYRVEDQKEIMLSFIGNKENKDNFIGIYNIKSAKITEIKEIPLVSARKFIDVNKYLEKYKDIKVFYVGIDYNVNKESMFYYNGVNYRLAVVAMENGQWKLAEMGDVPVDDIITSKIGFESSDEKIAVRIHQARKKGLFTNPSGKVIEDNAAKKTTKTTQSNLQVNSLNVATTASSYTVPQNINIYLTNPTNYQFYLYSGPTTQTMNFHFYTRNVLPNEWIASWPTNSLEAGAITVKMFAWYHIINPKFPEYNAALTDRASDSQVFLVQSSNPNTDAAIDAVPYGLETSVSLSLFETGYRAGSYDGSGYHSGLAYQNGSKYLADNGYNYSQILHYYYDNSYITNNETVSLFDAPFPSGF